MRGQAFDAAFTRRAVLIGAGACLTAPRGAAAKPADGLSVLLAPTGASVSVARAFDSGDLNPVAPNATLKPWRSNDELRAALVTGQVKLFSSPTHVPANLYNRGLPLRLLGLLGAGHLYIVTSLPGVAALKDLAGKPILGFFRNDMPDLVFRAVAKMEGFDADKDFELTYVQSAMEAAHMLAAGRVETAVLSEPMATGSIAMAAGDGRTLTRALSLQDLWSAHKGGHGVPMVGVAAHQSLVDDSPELIEALGKALPAGKDWALAHPGEAGALAEKTLGTKASVFAKALATMNLDYRPAKAARAELEAFYSVILETAPDALAGKLPGDSFYL